MSDTHVPISGLQHVSCWLTEALANPLPRIATGYVDLDAALDGGFVPGTLAVLAAPTSWGKSTIGLNLAATMSIALQTPTAIFTLEDSGRIVAHKLLSLVSNVELKRISTAEVSEDERQVLKSAQETMANTPLYISETSDLNKLRAELVGAVENGVRLILIDQLHHVQECPPPQNKYERISAVTRALQQMAMQTGATILALHQLNRDANKEGVKLHHLRDSGTIEQDSRLVLLVTKCERSDLDPTAPATLTVQVAKNSHGPVGRELKLIADFAHARIDTYVPGDK